MSPFKSLTPDCSLRNFRKLVGENSRYHGVCCVTKLRDASRSVRVVSILACRTDGLASACSAGYGNFHHLSRGFSIHYFMRPLNNVFYLCKVTSFYLL